MPPFPQGVGNRCGAWGRLQARWNETLSATMQTSGSSFPSGYWAKQVGARPPANLSQGAQPLGPGFLEPECWVQIQLLPPMSCATLGK